MRLRLPDRDPVDYQVLRKNTGWSDHILRTQVTASLIAWLGPDTVLDPACGDGSIVAAAHGMVPIAGAVLADLSRPNFYYVGTEMRSMLPENLRVSCATLEETLEEPNSYDLVVLTEILEHVEDPVAVLKMARRRATRLVASSPIFHVDDPTIDPNPEHLWQFDRDGYAEIMREAGWKPTVFMPIHFTHYMYDFQIWAAE